VRQYGKKVLLVINQIDLLSPAEQNDVRRFVERQVSELLDFRPLLFLVSAKQALADGSGGMDVIRAHLRGVFSELPPAQQKLYAQLDTAERLIRQYQSAAREHASALQLDTQKVRDVQRELETQSGSLNAQLTAARAELDRVFEGVRLRGLRFIEERMSIRQLGRGLDRERLQQDFREIVIGNTLSEVSTATNDYVNALIDSSRQYWRNVIDRLNQLRGILESEIHGLDADIYAEQREALQAAIATAENELKSYSTGRVLTDLEATFRANLNGFAWSAATTVIGTILSLVALIAPPGAAISPVILLTLPVTLIGGGAAWVYLRRVTAQAKHDFSARVDQIEKTYHDALDSLTQKERSRLAQYGKQVLAPIFSRLEVLMQNYVGQQRQLDDLLQQAHTLRKGIEQSV
jgi:hypothetical protein